MGKVTSFDDLIKKYPELQSMDDMNFLKLEISFRINTHPKVLEGKRLEYNPVKKTLTIYEDGLDIPVDTLTERSEKEFLKNNCNIFYGTFDKPKRIKHIEELFNFNLVNIFRRNSFDKLKEEGYILDFMDYRATEMIGSEVIDIYDKADFFMQEYYLRRRTIRSLGENTSYNDYTVLRMLNFQKIPYRILSEVIKYYNFYLFDKMENSISKPMVTEKADHIKKIFRANKWGKPSVMLMGELTDLNLTTSSAYKFFAKKRDKTIINICLDHPLGIKAYKNSVDIYRDKIERFEKYWSTERLEEKAIETDFSKLKKQVDIVKEHFLNDMTTRAIKNKFSVSNRTVDKALQGIYPDVMPKSLRAELERYKRFYSIKNIEDMASEDEFKKKYEYTDYEIDALKKFIEETPTNLYHKLREEARKEFCGKDSIFREKGEKLVLSPVTVDIFIKDFYEKEFRLPTAEETPEAVMNILKEFYPDFRTALEVSDCLPEDVRECLYETGGYPRENYLKIINKAVEDLGTEDIKVRKVFHGSKIKKMFGSMKNAVEEARKINQEG